MNNINIKKIVSAALREDMGGKDITTDLTVPRDQVREAVIVFREKAVVCGLGFAREAFRLLDPGMSFVTRFKDGDRISAGSRVVRLKGKARAILTAERIALNFLSYLSAIATCTQAFCDAVKPCQTDILDTRKTTPTLRELERYAVLIGGGVNHRFSLGDMVLIKDNHREFSHHFGGLTGLVAEVRRKTRKPVMAEADTLGELEKILLASPDMILLDNMSLKDLRRAVRIVKAVPRSRRPLLEASGGVTLKNVRAIARTGVDRISIGSLTHSRKAVDVSLEILE